MNEYGFVSAIRFKNITEMVNGDSSSDFHLSREKLRIIRDINPILFNNMDAYNLAISNPERYEAEYRVDPLTPREISSANELNASNMLYAPIGQILYKTSELGFRIPGDDGYDDYEKYIEIREMASKQISHAKTKEELNSLLSSKMKPDMKFEYGIDSKYMFEPISDYKKKEIDSKSIDELSNSTISEVLYKTRNVGEVIFLPQDKGYEEWMIAVNYRDAAINQLNSCNNEAEAIVIMNEPINKRMMDLAECENTGGLVKNTNGEWVKGYDYCIDKRNKENHASLTL
ncbi:hypothetical protein D051_0595 [Vibrio parahaemolyticus VPCR-2010]|uniref:hypothetical protein n=1 Tax=Vibrio parahaemolyticus TaxID=670 RepID=UPI00038E4CBB|nr:hypothetical protein D051_0595 [Vibrio parahaemolyticus VPCR-2010]